MTAALFDLDHLKLRMALNSTTEGEKAFYNALDLLF
jgi:hypothetical protein